MPSWSGNRRQAWKTFPQREGPPDAIIISDENGRFVRPTTNTRPSLATPRRPRPAHRAQDPDADGRDHALHRAKAADPSPRTWARGWNCLAATGRREFRWTVSLSPIKGAKGCSSQGPCATSPRAGRPAAMRRSERQLTEASSLLPGSWQWDIATDCARGRCPVPHLRPRSGEFKPQGFRSGAPDEPSACGRSWGRGPGAVSIRAPRGRTDGGVAWCSPRRGAARPPARSWPSPAPRGYHRESA